MYTSTLNRKGGCFIVSNPGPRVRHVLKITRLAEIVPIAADEAGAIQMLNLPQTATAGV
jgi:anti-anti-sigma regulatory factor